MNTTDLMRLALAEQQLAVSSRREAAALGADPSKRTERAALCEAASHHAERAGHAARRAVAQAMSGAGDHSDAHEAVQYATNAAHDAARAWSELMEVTTVSK